MSESGPVPPDRAVSRLKKKWFHPGSQTGTEVAGRPENTDITARRKNRFSASIAEFLLVFRLRARRTPASAASIMARALRMVLVTCEHWFGRADTPRSGPDKRR